MTPKTPTPRSILLAGVAGIAAVGALLSAGPVRADGTAPCNTNPTGGAQSVECGVDAIASGLLGATAVGGESTASGAASTAIARTRSHRVSKAPRWAI